MMRTFYYTERVVHNQYIVKGACFMQRIQIGSQSRVTSLFLACTAALLVVCIIIYPSSVFQSSLSGMSLWWEYVFPAMLPFLILSEIMIGSGAIHAIGTLLDPFMRFFFRISGNGGWALAMGLFAGYPAGASTVTTLQERKALVPLEAERVLSISHLCNPVVMITIIGVGFFHQASLGVFIAIVHYTSALLMGLMLRSSGGVKEKTDTKQGIENIWTSALRSAKHAQQEDGRTFGKILGDSVTHSIQTLMLIGGWMMFFSVLHQVILLLLPAFISDEGMITQLIVCFLEPHLGAYAITQHTSVSLIAKVAIIGAMLGWSGLSVHAQVKSLLQVTQIRYFSFVIARLLHASLAIILTVLLWKPLNDLLNRFSSHALPIYIEDVNKSSHTDSWVPSLWTFAGSRLLTMIVVLTLVFLCGVGISLAIQKIRLWSQQKPN
jgi:sporulation integral membrane protein YlbJ